MSLIRLMLTVIAGLAVASAAGAGGAAPPSGREPFDLLRQDEEARSKPGEATIEN